MTTAPMRPDDVAALGIEPLSARSVVLSALLGTHPPTLPGRSLVALAELFGIRPGTARTSMVFEDSSFVSTPPSVTSAVRIPSDPFGVTCQELT